MTPRKLAALFLLLNLLGQGLKTAWSLKHQSALVFLL